MKEFTAQVVKLLGDLNDLEKIAVEASSNDCSLLTQKTQAKAASQLYGVIEKKAREVGASGMPHEQVLELVEKMAEANSKAALTNEFKAKLAAAVVMDSTLQQHYHQAEEREKEKIAAMTCYGREYIAELLRSVLV
jgi:hypothetical protein